MADFGPVADRQLSARRTRKADFPVTTPCGRLLGQARFPKVAAHNYMVRQPSRAVCPNPS
jgi:hypothetical protein